MIFERLVAEDDNVKKLLDGGWKYVDTTRCSDRSSLRVSFRQWEPGKFFMGTFCTVYLGNQ